MGCSLQGVTYRGERVTKFVAPDVRGDLRTRPIAFFLFVDGGLDRSEPAEEELALVPPAKGTAPSSSYASV